MTDAGTKPELPRHLRGGNQPLSAFLSALALPGDFTERHGGDEDVELRDALDWIRHRRPVKQNHWPALTLAFVAQAEEVLAGAGCTRTNDVFADFELETGNSNKPVNTMNIIVGGSSHTLRPKYNRALDVIRVEMRRDHPSNAAHATQSWRAYEDLVRMIYRMSPAGRLRFAEFVWQTGVLEAAERRFATQAERIVRPFELVLQEFQTQGAKPGGALFQGLVYGYFRADSPNLTLESHSVNTGSGRADLIGDVAGFRGNEVELTVEVKDYAITAKNVDSVLTDFLEDLVNAPNATAVVAAAEVQDGAREQLAQVNVIALSREDLRQRVVTWDLPKQQEAIRGALYYLARIQKKTKLVDRLAGFLIERGIETGIIDTEISESEALESGQAGSTSLAVE